jgi:uncharacterized membrane protein YhaH (DUF805 family)
MSLIQFLFGFQGRIRRLHLWLFVLVAWALGGGLLWQFGHVGMHHGGDMVVMNTSGVHMWSDSIGGFHFVTHNPFAGVFGLVWFWMHLAVFVKRWHDRDKSGWMILLIVIPLVNIIGFFWTLIECGFMEGSIGPNRFGPDPKSR